MVAEAGWYPDYENGAQLRYHDGTQWTEHVHVGPTAEPTAIAIPPTEPTTSQVQDDPPAKQDAAWVRALMYPLLGAFAGLLVGGFVFNAVGAITPVTETTGTVDRIEVETEYSRTAGATSRTSYVLSGTTVDGDDWRIVDEDAYNVLQAEGYPQSVTLGIGNWTDTPERVTGASFEVNHQTTGTRVGWGAMLAVSGLIVAGTTALIARNKNGGAIHATTFVLFLIGPGVWLGFQAFQWIQSG